MVDMLTLKANITLAPFSDLYFPLLRDNEILNTIEPDSNLPQAKGESVLVIDDIEEQREIATIMLSRLGYAVDSVASGEEAVEFLRHRSMDVLVLDMIMRPGIDGLETYRQILEIRPNQKAIIVSGFSESEKVIKAQQLGTGPYVKKPYSIYEIATIIRAELDRKDKP